ncbi:MAG: glycosyltransferase family 2 protein, partial [Spirochaetaceae bacterium]|nr:glycosyltransferase family 2 protein [Spirochaetaceae bacterium]
MNEARVTVIVPSFNRARLLERTIPSYLQEGAGELILVDDCSTDETAAVVAGLAERDGRIRYLKSERTLKQTHAKNLGIAAARFPLLNFADDYSNLLPGSLPRLLATMEETGADIVGARAPYMESAEDAADPAAFAARQPAM